jgi:hypothetical protein
MNRNFLGRFSHRHPDCHWRAASAKLEC